MRHDHALDFDAWATARWPSLVRLAVFAGADPADAPDVAQDVLVRAARSWRRIRSAAHPEAYVYRMVLNAAHDTGRRPWRRERTAGLEPAADAREPRPDPDPTVSDAVRRALGDLPLEQRRVVVLRHLLQLTEAETAEVLQLPLGTVKSRCARGLARLATSPHLTDDTSHEGTQR